VRVRGPSVQQPACHDCRGRDCNTAGCHICQFHSIPFLPCLWNNRKTLVQYSTHTKTDLAQEKLMHSYWEPTFDWGCHCCHPPSRLHQQRQAATIWSVRPVSNFWRVHWANYCKNWVPSLPILEMLALRHLPSLVSFSPFSLDSPDMNYPYC
jgi:hypothetical protein